LVSAQGELIGSEFEQTQLLLLPGGGAEQSPTEWWQAITDAVKRLLGKGLVSNDSIAAIATTGQWSGTVTVDQVGNALSNAIVWMDARGAPFIQQICQGALNVEGYALGKLYKWLQLTGGTPARAGKDPIAHILYLKHAQPDLYRRAYKFLEPVDYLGLRLTGQMAASFNSIVLHWVTDNRNINHIPYNDGLIKISKIDRAKLPDLRPANSILGPVTREVAREWGLREDVQVVMGTPDIHSAAVGSGAVRDYELHLYIGTSSWLTCHVPFKKTDILHSLAALPSAIPGRYLLTNEQETAGACLQFLRDNLFFHEDELSCGEKPGNAYKLFDRIADRTPAGSEKLIFTPWLYGERAPVDDHLVRGGFFNQSLQTTREHMVRAVFEGVAYNSRWLLNYVERLIKRPAEAINFVGGGAKSDIWCQIHADVLNRPIRQMKDPIEVNVRGAALLAAVALGYLDYNDIGSCVLVANTYLPNPDHRKLYDELFGEFIAIYESNKKIYARLNRSR
jgi:xylulokinase